MSPSDAATIGESAPEQDDALGRSNPDHSDNDEGKGGGSNGDDGGNVPGPPSMSCPSPTESSRHELIERVKDIQRLSKGYANGWVSFLRKKGVTRYDPDRQELALIEEFVSRHDENVPQDGSAPRRNDTSDGSVDRRAGANLGKNHGDPNYSELWVRICTTHLSAPRPTAPVGMQIGHLALFRVYVGFPSIEPCPTSPVGC